MYRMAVLTSCRGEGVAGTASSQPSFDGGFPEKAQQLKAPNSQSFSLMPGLSFTANGGGPPPPAFWPGLTNVAGLRAFVSWKFYVFLLCVVVSQDSTSCQLVQEVSRW